MNNKRKHLNIWPFNSSNRENLVIFLGLFILLSFTSTACSKSEDFDHMVINNPIHEDSIIKNDHHLVFTPLFKMVRIGASKQGGAIYGDYLFQFHNTNTSIQIYYIPNGTLVQTLTLKKNTSNHAGSGGFGYFCNPNDPFPLLYISSMKEGKIYVYRLLGEIGSLNIALHQTIALPPGNELMYLPNCTIDRTNDKIVLFGYTNNTWDVDINNSSVFAYFDIPTINGDVIITTDNISNKALNNFIWAEQGACADKGKLYLCWGNTAKAKGGGIYTIDYTNGQILSSIDLAEVGSVEPEALGFYNSKLLLSTQELFVYHLED